MAQASLLCSFLPSEPGEQDANCSWAPSAPETSPEVTGGGLERGTVPSSLVYYQSFPNKLIIVNAQRARYRPGDVCAVF